MMVRLNKKGFMMAEVIVVSSVVLIILTTLYISYNKIFSLYENRLDYEDSGLIYMLAYYRDYLIKIDKLDEVKDNVKNNGNHYDLLTYNNRPLKAAVTELKSDPNFSQFENITDNVYLFYTEEGHLSGYDADNVNFKEYLDYLSGIKLLNSNGNNASYIMILERIYTDVKKRKYAYIVVG